MREPRFVVDGARLVLFFLELGADPKRFQPRHVHRVTTDGDTWAAATIAVNEPIVAWRVRRLAGRWAMLGYRGAEKMYSARPADPVVELRWSDDLDAWGPPIDLHQGGTECELVELADGRVLGLTRNEGPTRRGGDLLVGPDVDHLSVTAIARKLDSPNLFLWDGEPWLLARRQLAHGGRYDLAPRWMPGAAAIRLDQAVWSLTRKRSALYQVDPDRLAVRWELDLPSRGDTAFPAVAADDDGSVLVADYSSPAARGDHMWLRGQLGPTEIALHRLRRR